MSEQFEKLDEKHITFIGKQYMFFVGTAPREGSINVSPKGADSFRVLNERKIVWLNLTGSGNETAAHIFENNRMTVMFCSFDKQPLILRLYGQAKALHRRDGQWTDYAKLFPESTGTRQFFEMDIELVQTSCGFAVPLAENFSERLTLSNWAEKKGLEGIEEYWAEKNTKSIDNLSTGIFNDVTHEQ